jgi:Ricin-type beta-trefoil lectin domain
MGTEHSSSADGATVVVTFCKNDVAEGSKWYFDPVKECIFGLHSGKMLSWSDRTNNLEIKSYDPTDYNAFWAMPNAEIRHTTGKCLDVAGGSSQSGTQVWLWDCHGGSAQQWTFMSDGTVRTPTGKCLDGADNRMTISDCSGAPHQRWRLSDGWLRLPEMDRVSSNGACASVNSMSFPPNGAMVSLGSFCGGRGTRLPEFYLHGAIQNRLTFKCIVPPNQ